MSWEFRPLKLVESMLTASQGESGGGGGTWSADALVPTVNNVLPNIAEPVL